MRETYLKRGQLKKQFFRLSDSPHPLVARRPWERSSITWPLILRYSRLVFVAAFSHCSWLKHKPIFRISHRKCKCIGQLRIRREILKCNFSYLWKKSHGSYWMGRIIFLACQSQEKKSSKIIVALIYLSFTLGYSAAPGIVIMILYLPLNIFTSLAIKKWQARDFPNLCFTI